MAQSGAPVLTGKVSAGPEALEGVLVSAKRTGSTVTVTVVSDKQTRVLRGGAYGSPSSAVRSANRTPYQPPSRIDFLGFRVARTYP